MIIFTNVRKLIDYKGFITQNVHPPGFILLNVHPAQLYLKTYDKKIRSDCSHSLFWYSVGESNPYCKIENLEY